VTDYLPLLTVIVAFALASLVGMQYARKRRLHQLEWLLALALLGVAAVLAFLGNPDVLGWNAALYRLYLPLTAVPVGLIGLGVLQLFRDRPRLARYFGVYWIATAILVIAVAVLAPISNPAEFAQGPIVGYRAMPVFGAVAWLQTVAGASAFIGGGVYTSWKDRTRRYGLLFALGGVLFTIAGFSSRLGAPSGFFVITAIASFVTFLGFAWSVEHVAPAPSPAKA
jgi:hypothetical protein